MGRADTVAISIDNKNRRISALPSPWSTIQQLDAKYAKSIMGGFDACQLQRMARQDPVVAS
jgi:hypothetical protein